MPYPSPIPMIHRRPRTDRKRIDKLDPADPAGDTLPDWATARRSRSGDGPMWLVCDVCGFPLGKAPDVTDARLAEHFESGDHPEIETDFAHFVRAESPAGTEVDLAQALDRESSDPDPDPDPDPPGRQ